MNCPTCDAAMERKDGSYGPFWGCSNFPKCAQKAIGIKEEGPKEEKTEKEAIATDSELIRDTHKMARQILEILTKE